MKSHTPIENLSGKYKWKESAKEAKIKAEKLASEEIKKSISP